MKEEPKVKCPQCGAMGTAGDVCEYCGAVIGHVTQTNATTTKPQSRLRATDDTEFTSWSEMKLKAPFTFVQDDTIGTWTCGNPRYRKVIKQTTKECYVINQKGEILTDGSYDGYNDELKIIANTDLILESNQIYCLDTNQHYDTGDLCVDQIFPNTRFCIAGVWNNDFELWDFVANTLIFSFSDLIEQMMKELPFPCSVSWHTLKEHSIRYEEPHILIENTDAFECRKTRRKFGLLIKAIVEDGALKIVEKKFPYPENALVAEPINNNVKRKKENNGCMLAIIIAIVLPILSYLLL